MKAILYFVICFSVHSALAEEPVLERWLAKQSSINSLDVEFTQERKLPALKQATTTRGKLVFSKPDKVRWQLGDPIQSLVVSTGQEMTFINTSEKVARRTDIDSPQASHFSLLTGKSFASTANFHASFRMVETRQSNGIYQFTIQSNDRKMRTQIPWIFISIDPAQNELRALEIELKDKSRVKTTFGTARVNLPIDPKLFTPDLTGYKLK